MTVDSQVLYFNAGWLQFLLFVVVVS